MPRLVAHLVKRNKKFISILSIGIQCPGNGTCSNQGTCDVSNGTCICISGFEGDACQGKSFLYLQGQSWQTGFFESALTDRISKLDFI